MKGDAGEWFAGTQNIAIRVNPANHDMGFEIMCERDGSALETH